MANKNKSPSIKMTQEKLQEKAEDFINTLHNGETVKGYIDYVKEMENLSFPLQQVICKNILKRKISYTKFHFRKQDLRHLVYTTEKLATFLEEKGNKSLAKQCRQEKNDWLSKGLWEWRKKHINSEGKFKGKTSKKESKKVVTKKHKVTPVKLLCSTGKQLIRNGKPIEAVVTPDGQIKILGKI